MTEDHDPLDPVFVVPSAIRAIAACFLGPLAVLALVVPWLLPLKSGDLGMRFAWILFGIIIAAAFAWAILSVFRTRLEFLATGIRLTKGFGASLEIQSDDIEGYRIFRGKNSKLKIFYKDAARSPLVIDMSFGRQEELVATLEDKYTDLDSVAKRDNMREILSDARLGSTVVEREGALKRAKIHAGILNVASGLVVAWTLFYPRPYDLVIMLLALLPFAGLGLVLATHGTVTLDSDRNNVRPTAAFSILTPAVFIAYRALRDWHILGWSGFWIPFAVLSGILVGCLFACSAADSKRTAGTLIILSVALMGLSYGLVVFLNCRLDRSVPVIHRAEVTSRRISRGSKSTSYYLTVSPWIDGAYSEQVSVPRSTYSWHNVGSTVLIGVRPGALSMPWYFVQ